MTQARGQNNRSKALKWGIVNLCTSNTFGDVTKYMKIWVSIFCISVKIGKITVKNRRNWKMSEKPNF